MAFIHFMAATVGGSAIATALLAAAVKGLMLYREKWPSAR
jgi:hypothetical protein